MGINKQTTISEGGEGGASAGAAGGGASTANSNRPPQQRLEEIESAGDGSVQQEYGLSDGDMESLNEARIDEGFSDGTKGEIKEGLASGMSNGDLTQAQVERLEFTKSVDDSDFEGDIGLKVNSNNTPYAGETQTVRVATDGADGGQVRRLVQQEVAPANGIVDRDNAAAEENRAVAVDADRDDADVFDRDASAVKAETGNENMEQGHVGDQIAAANSDIETFYEKETFLAGARNNRGDGVASTIDFRKTMVDEVESGEDNTGTNVWNNANETYAEVVGSRVERGNGDAIADHHKEQIDILHAASEDVDVVSESNFDDVAGDGDAVFDEDNLTQETVDRWKFRKMSNFSQGAGVSRNLVEDVQEWAQNNLPES